MPIKATDFPNKPTLKYLERKFRVNEELRQPHKARVKNAIDLALLKQPNHSLQGLISALEKEGIHTARRETAAGMIYGLTYLDHKTKCVFNGSDLGKPYSAKSLQERCRQVESIQLQTVQITSVKAQNCFSLPGLSPTKQPIKNQEATDGKMIIPGPSSSPDSKNMLDLLLKPEPAADYIPGHLLKMNRKKRQRRPTGHH